jgi:hypothetical protein
MENIDFNERQNMIIDTSFFSELYYAESIKSYNELMAYMAQFMSDFYEKNNIYTEKHYYNNNELNLPASIHFLAHILLARESANKVQDYSSAIQIANKSKMLKKLFQKEIKEARQYYRKCSHQSYENQNGPIGAQKRKQKLSKSMSNLSEDFIKNRNRSISLKMMKKVKHIQTGKIYDNAYEASKALGIGICSIRKCCYGKIENFHGDSFTYCS